MGTEELQPIEWRVWAGKVERERKGGPYAGLEERMGFVNIRVCGALIGLVTRSIFKRFDVNGIVSTRQASCGLRLTLA